MQSVFADLSHPSSIRTLWRSKGDQVHVGIRFFARWCCYLPHGLKGHKKERSHRHPEFSTKLALIPDRVKEPRPLKPPYYCNLRDENPFRRSMTNRVPLFLITGAKDHISPVMTA
jgi:hypothetical protein